MNIVFAHLELRGCDYTRDFVGAVCDETHSAHLSQCLPGSRRDTWGLCSSAQDLLGAAKGHPALRRGRRSQTGPRLRGCEPVWNTEGSKSRLRCWLPVVALGTDCDPECLERSTCYEGRHLWKDLHLTPGLCSAERNCVKIKQHKIKN